MSFDKDYPGSSTGAAEFSLSSSTLLSKRLQMQDSLDELSPEDSTLPPVLIFTPALLTPRVDFVFPCLPSVLCALLW